MQRSARETVALQVLKERDPDTYGEAVDRLLTYEASARAGTDTYTLPLDPDLTGMFEEKELSPEPEQVALDHFSEKKEEQGYIPPYMQLPETGGGTDLTCFPHNV